MAIGTNLLEVAGKRIFLVGVKGTGLSGLADLLVACGADVSGSDTTEHFYTEERLRELNVRIYDGTTGEKPGVDYDLVIYSAAYSAKTNAHLGQLQRQKIPCYSYTQFLGLISRKIPTIAIAGVHGKTTITGMIAAIAQGARIPFLVISGGQVNSIGNRSIYYGGTDCFVVEACEYRRHFFDIDPNILLVNAIESDHQDYYKHYKDIFSAFYDYANSLPTGGILLCCSDDRGAGDLADIIERERDDITVCRYGNSAGETGGAGGGGHGGYTITQSGYRAIKGTPFGALTQEVTVNRWPKNPLTLNVPGAYNIPNAVGALAALDALTIHYHPFTLNIKSAVKALAAYSGAKRRCQVIGEWDNILIIDDYAHHPTAIAATIAGVREFYPKRRIIVDFMPHTYSRTTAMLQEFAQCFVSADIVYTHDVYPSARENESATVRRRRPITGKRFAAKIAEHHNDVRYFPTFAKTQADMLAALKGGDLLLTLGAGDNWQVGKAVAGSLAESASLKKPRRAAPSSSPPSSPASARPPSRPGGGAGADSPGQGSRPRGSRQR